MHLHELLSQQREELLLRWSVAVCGPLHPDAVPPSELRDRLPEFIDEIAEALRAREGLETSTTAAEHGTQRLRLGFDLGAVVREYGELRNCIVSLAREKGVTATGADLQVLFDCTITGIADAVTEYSRQRDAELRRQATEHFAFVAHELRNPLQSSLTALSLLKTRREVPENRATGALESGLSRMHELIEHSLQLAWHSSGVTVARSPVRLCDLVDEVEVAIASDVEEQNIRLHTHVEGGATVLHVDPRLVRSALSNLVRNAVKFTRPGGSVDIRARVAGRRALLEVEDECGGLAPGMTERAFAPFIREDEQSRGFGLGLAIAKQAVDAHAGSIRVQNLPGKGCIFVLDLPISAVEPSPTLRSTR